jgi:ribosomal protein L23
MLAIFGVKPRKFIFICFKRKKRKEGRKEGGKKEGRKKEEKNGLKEWHLEVGVLE